MNFLTKRDRGFTLIELLVVIAIIGILSSVVLASLNSARQKSRDARRIGDIKQLQLALEMYYDSNNGYPTSTAALAPDYIPVEPTDPQTGAVYTYAASSTSNYVLRATLESDHNALDSDIDGTVFSVDCTDASSPYYYCVQP
ncbi:prepilin-type cleavage/methylation domain-containing protein [bacterium]|nr:prepilin-type cleavage/methylation domain-containing protein [bacterium]|tara:strand:+ start:5919 stop:6344 length:426 start_codon:yes stop_codon:yes gene_type:complete